MNREVALFICDFCILTCLVTATFGSVVAVLVSCYRLLRGPIQKTK